MEKISGFVNEDSLLNFYFQQKRCVKSGSTA